MSEKQPKTKIKNRFFLTTKTDLGFLLAILLLNVIGIIMIYSASSYYAVSAYSFSPTYYLFNQLKYVIPGFLLLIAISFFRPFFIKKFWWISLVFTFILLIAVRIPGIGRSSHGAYRWIGNSSFSLQVAEPIKLFMIVFMAGFMIKFKAYMKRKPALILMGICSLVSALLFFLSNNLSTAIIVLLMAFFTLMMTYPRTKWFWITLAGAALIIVVFIVLVLVIPYQKGENFRITRIRAWLQPTNEQFVAGEAYQATQALYAISTGGFFGKGLGQSLLKFKLPEPMNDYILAIVFEELGILGVLLLTYLFVYLLYKIFKVYLETEERFSKYLVLGVFFHLALQILLNYGVTLGFFPTMGVTLPFISSGGSSALFTLMELGMVFSVSKQNAENRLYKEAREEEQDLDPYYKQLVEEARLGKSLRKGKKVRPAHSTEGEQ